MMRERQKTYTVRWVLFGFSGRLSRASFILGFALVFCIQGLIFARILSVPEQSAAAAFWGLIMLLSWGASLWVSLALCVKRLNDANLPRLLAGLVFFPMLGILTMMVLAIIPSHPDSNDHGAPPFPPSAKG